MKTRWVPLAIIAALLAAMLVWKSRSGPPANNAQLQASSPQMLLVATQAEAVSQTRCGDIVRLVRAASQRGIRVRELTPDSRSELISRHHVLTTPTVLIFDSAGSVRSRYEGESVETLEALRLEIQKMQP